MAIHYEKYYIDFQEIEGKEIFISGFVDLEMQEGIVLDIDLSSIDWVYEDFTDFKAISEELQEEVKDLIVCALEVDGFTLDHDAFYH